MLIVSVEKQHSQSRNIAIVAILAITISLVFGLATREWAYFLIAISLSSLTVFADQEEKKAIQT